LKTTLLYLLLYTNATGIPAALFMPRIVHWAAERSWPLAFVVGLGSAFFTVVGCFVAGKAIVFLGVSRAETFWTEYFTIVRFCVLLAVIASVGVFLSQSLRQQLSRQTERLNEQRLSAERAQKLAVEARLASLESRIQPHFLFNTLNSISALIPVDPQSAEQMVEQLARLLRSSLDNSRQSLVPLEKELRLVHDYLEIEKERFGAKLKTSIDVPLQLQTAAVPPFGLQSLVENAIKHGIGAQRNGGALAITARTDGQNLHLEVRDNGPGFDLTAVPSGHGLDNLVGRLTSLFGDKAHLNVFHRDSWCVVDIVIPRRERELKDAAGISG
jgi:LytS/YehU family sensor histidine kinase